MYCRRENFLPLNHHEVYNLPVLEFHGTLPDQPDYIWMIHCSLHVRLMLELLALGCWEWKKADEHTQY